jgi:hypothetical protein
MRLRETLICISTATSLATASSWPGGPGSEIEIIGASNDLSGATWNTQSQSLWVVRQDRTVWEFAYDAESMGFELVRTLAVPAEVGWDIEACTQVDHAAVNELYTLDENDGRISRVVDLDGTPTVLRSWELTTPNNGHELPGENASAGAEALEFVPDADLLAAGFRFPDGSTFAGSTKGMGGLMFVGHQIEGRLHVFDLNPNVSEDFVNHGSFLTAASEIAGLHFDRSSGLMYLWHNPGNVNSLEVSTLASESQIGTIDTIELYDSDMPSGNLEGIALVGNDACGAFGAGELERVLFLTQDGGVPPLAAFSTFPCTALEGACCVSSGCDVVTESSCANFGGAWLGEGTTCESCPALCEGDLDGSGEVTVEDLLTMLSHWGMCP